MTKQSKRIVLIYGPTASGKSATALDIAEKENGVIINADSMQVYDALHVLTAQPSQEEQEQAPHRLYAVLDPAEKCSAARWREMVLAEIEDAFANNQTPVICGGTGFYIKSLIEGLSPIPDVPDEIRQMAMEIQSELGNPAFHGALTKKDPAMAKKLNPHDTQRLIRAWEVFHATGKSLAYWQSLPKEGPPEDWTFEHHFINPDRDLLRQRINDRFDMMIEAGVLDEVKTLAAKIENGEVPHDAGIIIAHGFRPLRAYLHGECELEDAIEQSKLETRQYAKRQRTWLRNQFS